ncbi:MAG: Flp pilus assembly complex ATPase component TadA [Bdellovibrionales bacterium]|nr:Flp pilus assembly complex ATPase component TadA [Bdellovibrionales bacterium]
MASYLISIFGPKSGVGKSILTTNVGYALARQSRGRVLILDFDLHDCGDIALLLGSSQGRSMLDLAPKAHKISEHDLDRYIKKNNDGVYILSAVSKFRQSNLLDPQAVSSILSLLKKKFQYIVADCGSIMFPQTIKVFEQSSLVLFCTTPEILSLTRSVQSLQEFQELAFPSDLIQLVVNRYDPRGVITEAIIRQKLKKNCLALLPDQLAEVQNSVHQGVPIFKNMPRSVYSRMIEELSRAILTKNLLKPVDLQLNTSGMMGFDSPTVGSKGGSQRLFEKPIDKEADRLEHLRGKIHVRLIDMMDFRKLSPEELVKQDQASLEALKNKTREAILKIVDQMPEISSRSERQLLVKDVLDEAIGYGPLEDLLQNPEVSEIMVNRSDQIYVEKSGKISLVNARFTSNKQLMGVIERIVAPIGRRIDEKTPMVDARLRDGSRVHAIIPPLAMDGPMLTIRKFSHEVIGPKQLITFGAMSEEISDFLRACVQAKLNILISGGTGTGKTTLLNTLAGFVPNDERIITVEDSAELNLPQEHVGRLESRPANLQGEGEIPIRELVRNTLRMRPDRIIVGECRGSEALDMLQAMNTGHDGSMTTIHANSPRDSIARLETLVMFAGMDLPSRAIREQIASAVSLIVQLSRLSDGSRKITAVTEVTGLESATVSLQDIFTFKEKGLDAKGKVQGSFTATGLVPTFASEFKKKGIKLPKGLFSE